MDLNYIPKEPEAISQLRTALEMYMRVSAEAQGAYQRWSELSSQLREATAALEVEVASATNPATGKPYYSNDMLRRAEVERRLKLEHAELVEDCAIAERHKRATAEESALLGEELSTLRTIVRYMTADLELRTAAVNGETALHQTQQ